MYYVGKYSFIVKFTKVFMRIVITHIIRHEEAPKKNNGSSSIH